MSQGVIYASHPSLLSLISDHGIQYTREIACTNERVPGQAQEKLHYKSQEEESCERVIYGGAKARRRGRVGCRS